MTAKVTLTGIGELLAVLVALVTLATAAAKALRSFNRRRHPDSQPIQPVDFSGRTRQAFLDRVWAQRIVNTLERSIEYAAEMRLGLLNTPGLVAPSSSQSTAKAGENVQGIEAAYEQAGGQLVIVGGPGSGKTTEALRLMRPLLDVARGDASAPAPELFPLASWAKHGKPLLYWLGDPLPLRTGWLPIAGRS